MTGERCDPGGVQYTRQEEPFPESTVSELWGLAQACFDPGPLDSFRERLTEKRRPFAVIAHSGALPVGFKLGYERFREEFYSWLGGVHPEYRRRGIARRLLLEQHEWSRRAGYERVSTEALGDNTAMLALNLQHGFHVVGTRVDDRGLKVLLVRHLRRDRP